MITFGPQRRKQRDRAFAAWYEASAPEVSRQLAVAIKDDQLTFEAVADAYARAYERWPRVSKMENPNGWVYRTGLNSAKRVWRRRELERRAVERNEREQLPGIVLIDPEAPEMADELSGAVADLPPQMQKIVRLKYWDGLKEREIAEQLGIAPGTVATTLHAARKKLSHVLVAEQSR